MSTRLSSWSADAGFVTKWCIRITVSPTLSLSVVGSSVLALSVALKSAQSAFLGGLLLPWVILVLLFVSLPSIGGLVRRYRLPDQVRRNHALEHGTICFLRKRYGKRYKLSGRSEERGFRIAGARTVADIQAAFAELVRQVRAGNEGVVIARGCGSNMVTAQSTGLVLMALLVVSMITFSLSTLFVGVSLVCILAFVLLIRYPVGMRIQKRRFLLVDFSEASILSVHPVNHAELFERHPVFFVRTQVSVRQDRKRCANRNQRIQHKRP